MASDNLSLSGALPSNAPAEYPSSKLGNTQTIQGYSKSPVSSPIRIPSISNLPPRLSTVVPPSLPTLNSNIRTPSIIPAPIFDQGKFNSSPGFQVTSLQPNISQGFQVASPNISLPVAPVSKSVSVLEKSPQIQFNEVDSIENKLLKLGYLALETIKYRKGNNELVAKYIKAIDENRGNVVMIELNVDSNVLVQPSDLTTIESNMVVSIPSSLRHGILSEAGNEVAGVAFECREGFCISTHDTVTMKPSDKFIKIIEKPGDRVAVDEESILGIPIIRLSDIIENPTLAAEIISASTLRIRNAAIKSFHHDLDLTNKVDTTLDAKIKITMKAMNLAMNNILVGLERFEEARKVYDLNPPVTPMAKNEYSVIVLNIKKRQNMIRRLLMTTRKLEDKRNRMNILSKEMEDIITNLDANFKMADKAIYTS
jgi:hypothetical protein